MKAYEIPVKVSADGTLGIPPAFAEILPKEKIIRVIFLVSEPSDGDEQTMWSCLTTEQFLAGYSEADAIYDKVS